MESGDWLAGNREGGGQQPAPPQAGNRLVVYLPFVAVVLLLGLCYISYL